MIGGDPVARARGAYDRRSWTEACEAFRVADAARPLDNADLDRLAIAAQLIGEDGDAVDAWTRAHHGFLRAGDRVGAARVALWLGMMLLQAGDMAQGGGWLGRANRLIEESGTDCVERGFVLFSAGLQQLNDGATADAHETFERATTIAERFADPDLEALARLGRGRALIDLSRVAEGVALLDEAMLAVTTDEVSPIIAGTVYCAAIEGYTTVFDLRRAQQWTDALTAWCDAQPDLVPFRGRCLVYRAELLRLHGAWPEAIDVARRAQAWLSRPPPEPAVGEAHYQVAELHRLRGEFAAAETAYREASDWGRRAEPGLALMRLEQGQRDPAEAMLRRAIDEAPSDAVRAALLPPFVEVLLARRDVRGARAAATDLALLAGRQAAPMLAGMASLADGVVLLAEGDARAALHALRRSAAVWQEIDAPYESARVRGWIGQALQRLGDVDTASLEFEAARRVFRELGAAPDLARLETLAGVVPGRAGGLSGREIEILRLLAQGMTNRAIATDLGISPRTVDRHVSNIFSKIDVSTRSAATAYAYEHDLA